AYGRSYLFTGDAGTGVEADLIRAYGKSLKSDVLKVGHHGSDTSTSSLFLDYVDPDVGIISLGPNRHGFPHRSVLASLADSDVEIMRTDEAGTIHYVRRKNGGKWVKHIPNGA
ncbi:MAG: ComEC/Rec2 family competence protein, partial [Acholeplasmataceae bacterium]